MKHTNYLLLIPLAFLFACVSAEQTTDQTEKKTPDVYVFDDVKKAEEPKNEQPKVEEQKPEVKPEPTKVDSVITESTASVKKFTVQLGAFTTKERADSFVKEHQAKTSLPLTISFNAKTKLFAVQVPPYKTKEEADLIRDNLRKFSAFGDSFTVSVEN